MACVSKRSPCGAGDFGEGTGDEVSGAAAWRAPLHGQVCCGPALLAAAISSAATGEVILPEGWMMGDALCPLSAQHRASHRDIRQFMGSSRATQHQRATAHVPAAHEIRGKQKPL